MGYNTAYLNLGRTYKLSIDIFLHWVYSETRSVTYESHEVGHEDDDHNEALRGNIDGHVNCIEGARHQEKGNQYLWKDRDR